MSEKHVLQMAILSHKAIVPEKYLRPK
uniref:Uncharacterized protein n=1 Tax=Anguilla anguilla TaxID=7936 RepID=A0A0E9UCN1_ANGAN